MPSPYSVTYLAILDDALLSIGGEWRKQKRLTSGAVAAKNATNLAGSPT
jgi:hypothetical protein